MYHLILTTNVKRNVRFEPDSGMLVFYLHESWSDLWLDTSQSR